MGLLLEDLATVYGFSLSRFKISPFDWGQGTLAALCNAFIRVEFKAWVSERGYQRVLSR